MKLRQPWQLANLDVSKFERENATMKATSKRPIVYFDPELHRALRRKAAETDRSLSELVNEAVKLSLAEDAEDLAAFETRVAEPDVPFEDALRVMRRRGKI
jgi:hypothetical protein